MSKSKLPNELISKIVSNIKERPELARQFKKILSKKEKEQLVNIDRENLVKNCNLKEIKNLYLLGIKFNKNDKFMAIENNCKEVLKFLQDISFECRITKLDIQDAIQNDRELVFKQLLDIYKRGSCIDDYKFFMGTIIDSYIYVSFMQDELKKKHLINMGKYLYHGSSKFKKCRDLNFKSIINNIDYFGNNVQDNVKMTALKYAINFLAGINYKKSLVDLKNFVDEFILPSIKKIPHLIVKDTVNALIKFTGNTNALSLISSQNILPMNNRMPGTFPQ